MMIVITTTTGRKYWTNSYEDKDGFLSFKSQSKQGVDRDIKVNKASIVEVAQMESEFRANPGHINQKNSKTF